VTTAGCLLWACMTALFGSAKTLQHGMAAWAMNGLGLAMVGLPGLRPLTAVLCTAAYRKAQQEALQPIAVGHLLYIPLQVIPSGQSLIADFYTDSNRGKAFGGLFLTGAVGGMLGSLYATNLGKRPLFVSRLYRLCSATLFR
jgi:hypothetical protein